MVQDKCQSGTARGRDSKGTRWNGKHSKQDQMLPSADIPPSRITCTLPSTATQSRIKCCHLQPFRQAGSHACCHPQPLRKARSNAASAAATVFCETSWDVRGRIWQLVLRGTPAAPKAALALQGGGPAHAGSGTRRAAWRAALAQWAPARLQLESAGWLGQHKSRQTWKTVRAGHRSCNAAGRSAQRSDQIATNGAPTRLRQGTTPRTARR